MNKKRVITHSKISLSALYDGWMRFGKVMNKIMTTILFSAVFLTIVPVLALWKFISRLKDQNRESFWISRAEKKIDLEFFNRMG